MIDLGLSVMCATQTKIRRGRDAWNDVAMLRTTALGPTSPSEPRVRSKSSSKFASLEVDWCSQKGTRIGVKAVSGGDAGFLSFC